MPCRRIEEWKYSSTHSWFRHQMQVSCQLHAPAALYPVLIALEAGLAPEPVWTRWRKEKFPAPPRNRNLDRRARSQSLYRLSYHGSSLIHYTYLLHGTGYYLKSWLSLSLSKNIPLSYGTRRFITVFTKARHWTLSWDSRIQFTT
jgi:hypothetical protein